MGKLNPGRTTQLTRLVVVTRPDEFGQPTQTAVELDSLDDKERESAKTSLVFDCRPLNSVEWIGAHSNTAGVAPLPEWIAAVHGVRRIQLGDVSVDDSGDIREALRDDVDGSVVFAVGQWILNASRGDASGRAFRGLGGAVP